MLQEILTTDNYKSNLLSIQLLCMAVLMGAMIIRNLVDEGISRVSIAFSLLLSVIFIWFLSFSFMYSATHEYIALFWAKTSYLGVAFIPAAMYFFIISTLNISEKRKYFAFTFCLLSSIYLAVITGTDIIIKGVHRFPWGYYPQYSLWSFAFLVPFFLVLALCFGELRRGRRLVASASVQYKRVNLFMIALGIGSISSIDYLPKFGISLYPVGYLAIFIALGIMQVAIWRYRLICITPGFAAESIIDTMNDALLVLDSDGIIRLSNHSSAALFGIPEEELSGRHITNFISDANILEILECGDGVISGQHELSYEHPDRGSLVVNLSASFMQGDNGQVMAVVCIFRDITALKKAGAQLINAHEALGRKVEERTIELRRANEQLLDEIEERTLTEQALRRSEERYALAAQGSKDGLWDWDLTDSSIYFSSRWKKLVGHAENEIGSSVEEWFGRIHPDDIEQLRHAIRTHQERPTSHFQSEYRMVHKDGTYRWMHTRGVAIRNESGKIFRMAGSQTDITERRRKEEKLLHDAFHDSLTNLPNRALLIDRLEHALKLQKRDPSLIIAVLFLDLDRFKVINDSLGHRIGDRLLVAVATRLEESFRNSDTIAYIGETFSRLGGDEFVIMLEGIKSRENAESVATRIQNDLKVPFIIEGYEIFVTASIGIAISSDDYESAEELLRDADTAMYGAKELGKARYQIFDPGMHRNALRTLQIEMDLRRAIERHEFRIQYQPIVSLDDGKLRRLEALIRWDHPVHGTVSPLDFIPIAEDNGLIHPIGEWVLEKACSQIKRWHDSGVPRIRVAVNISARQLRQKHFPEMVARLLRESELDAQFLELEITESLMIESPEEALTVLTQLSNLGIRLSLDDFGTGYSSLSYLPRFPIDTIKIDRSFIKKISLDTDTMQVVASIIDLCQKMGKSIVAEGIETPDQLKLLEGLRCSFGQGYLFSMPLDEAAITELISDHRNN